MKNKLTTMINQGLKEIIDFLNETEVIKIQKLK